MIALQHEENLLAVSIFGQFTLADFKRLEEEVGYEVRFHGPVNLLVDLRDMLDYTLDVAIEELRFTRSHVRDFPKIAVLAERELVVWSALLSRLFTGAQIRVFDAEPDAREWLAQPAP